MTEELIKKQLDAWLTADSYLASKGGYDLRQFCVEDPEIIRARIEFWSDQYKKLTDEESYSKSDT